MQFDFSAPEIFFDYLDGKASLDDVLQHPAYRAVFSHSSKFGDGLDPADIAGAAKGEQTRFFGVNGILQNRQRITEVLRLMQEQQHVWQSEIITAIERVFPGARLDEIRICPIIGYDAGIGHNNCLCMNINWGPYLQRPIEFLYTAIHEAFHAVYEHLHDLPDFAQVTTSFARQDYFYTMLQNEGGAVYAPLELRRRNNDMGNTLHRIFEDYLVLQDVEQMRAQIDKFQLIEQRLSGEPQMTLDEYANLVFSNERITYRVGCKLLQLIEEHSGIHAVREAVKMDGREFVERHRGLLEQYGQ